MAPNLKKAAAEFIDDIPKDKLTGYPNTIKTIYKDLNFRFDMQGLTATHWNLQVQANKNAPNTSVARFAPKTVAHVLVSFKADPSTMADRVRAAFLTSAKNNASTETVD